MPIHLLRKSDEFVENLFYTENLFGNQYIIMSSDRYRSIKQVISRSSTLSENHPTLMHLLDPLLRHCRLQENRA